MTNLGEIKTRIWQEMEQNSDSTTYNTKRLTDMVNEVSQEIREGEVGNEITGTIIKLNSFSGTESKFAIKRVTALPIGGDITTSSVEILIDTTNLENSGAILLGDEVIEYTAKEATKITGVTGILSEHKEGEIATILNKCPTNFWKPMKAYYKVGNTEINIPMEDNLNNISKYYEIYKANNTYINFNGLIQSDTIYITYKTKYELLTDDTDVCLFEQNTAINIIPFICGGRMIKDEILKVKLLNQGYNKLVNESDKQGNASGKSKGINWKRFGFNSIR